MGGNENSYALVLLEKFTSAIEGGSLYFVKFDMGEVTGPPFLLYLCKIIIIKPKQSKTSTHFLFVC